MEDKYYVPSIEEFYDDFEFEMKSNTYNKCFNVQILNDWFTEEFCYWFDDTGESTYHDVTKGIEKGNIRVKHLNCEDIESLEWEYKLQGESDDQEVAFQQFQKGNYFMTHDSNGLVIIDKHRSDGEFTVVDQLFKGTIKNKSVFKQVLKMIGI